MAVIGTFEGKCCDSNIFNNNDMKLSSELFVNLINSDEYKRAIEYGHYIGFLGHPEDPGCQDFEHACIVMKSCRIDDNGEIFGTFDLIDTPVGRIVASFIDAGVKFGISIRGAGDVDADGNVDPDTFVFRGFDLVAFPAYDDCIPEFKQIAASSDIDKQVKYKKVCSTIKKNLKSITSSSTLEIIRDQFNEDSPEYIEVDNQIKDIEKDSDLELLHEKVESLTDMYINEHKENIQLRQAIADLNDDVYNIKIECNRKLASYKKIVGSQLGSLKTQLSKSESCLKVRTDELQKARSSVEASNRTIDLLKNENLKYVRKIESTSEIISQKNSAIEGLESKLSETVTANTNLKNSASNRDDSIKELTSRVEAAEKMILQYQQAYANMYANALGVHINNMSVTASTSVDELQSMITAHLETSTRDSEYDSVPQGLVDSVSCEDMVTL